MAGAWLVVRAVGADPADRAAFDTWYHNEHLPDTVKAFSVQTAWRGWSKIDPAAHCAHYHFESSGQLDAIMRGQAIMDLIAEFDQRWGPRVTRTRDVLNVSDAVGE